MTNKTTIIQKLERKKKRLETYLAREAILLSPDGVQSYGVGSRNLSRYQTDLGEIRRAIEDLENEIEELEGLLTGCAPRKAVGVIPRDW